MPHFGHSPFLWGVVLMSSLIVRAQDAENFDVVIVGGTPGGITAAIGAARGGCSVALLDRTAHVGGLPANGLGATDIATRGCTGGLFLEFVQRIRAHYVCTYGEKSEQVRTCSDGYHFEPSVAEKVFAAMLAEHPSIAVRRMRQFDAQPGNVTLENGRPVAIRVLNRETNAIETYRGKVFVDATYEGDLAAASGAPWRTRREGRAEYHEPLAGRVYKAWRSRPDEVGEGSTGEGDDVIQAYNYRLCLTADPKNRLPVERPATYRRDEFASLAADLEQGRYAGTPSNEAELDGIGRIVNMVFLPNGKTDSNNQHLAFISTDLPEENYPWPTADWAWRDRFALRLREYTLGLLYFAQNDESLPKEFREKASRYGLAKDEYTDNGNFPRQVYVREGRRIEGEHLFTAHDSIPVQPGARPPLHASSITASHYAIDSHAVRKREPDRVHLDGFLSYPTLPYTVPYGTIVPKKVEQLLTPVPVSATHLGFGTLRMEPCWMALGQAAGVAAALSIRSAKTVREIDVATLQDELLAQKAILIYFKDVPPTHPHFAALQRAGLRGLLTDWQAKPDEPVAEADAKTWNEKAGTTVELEPGMTRGEFLSRMSRTTKARAE